MPPHAPDLIHERVKMLIEELARRDGKARGWQRRVAEQLGLHQPTISAILSDQRRAAWNMASAVAARIGLDTRFFTDENPEEWLLLQDLKTSSEAERSAHEMTLFDLQSEARALLRMLEGAPHRRQVVEVNRLAQDVLDFSQIVRAARAVQNAKPDEQLMAGAALARALFDANDPIGRLQQLPASEQDALKLDAYHRAMSDAIGAFSRVAAERGVPRANVKKAIENEAKLALRDRDDD